MAITEYNWKSRDGKKVYAKKWTVANPKGVICLVHGAGEHCNRYNHFADFFNKNGFSVFSCDLPGHGQTEGKKGHANGIEAFMDEVSKLLTEAVEDHPDLPIFLYGHSMGGNISLNYLIRRNPKIQGLIVSGPWIRLPKPPPAILLFVGRILNLIAPSFVLATDLDGTLVSRDPEVVKKYQEDPLVHGLASARMGISMTDAAKFLDQYDGELSVPTLIMHGSDDGLTSCPASEDFVHRVSGDVTLKIWNGLYHEIHNEKEQKEVFEYALFWITNHIQ
jgi:alpha-beta hydrolase superfamily lysophospholipase